MTSSFDLTPEFLNAFMQRRTLLKGSVALAALAASGALPLDGGAQAAAPAKGGKLTLGVNAPAGFGPIDPHRMAGDFAVDLANHFTVFETLTRQANDGSLEMLLAESITPDDDTGTAWTIRIKKGVLFHDGREFTADDVIASIKRIREPGTTTGGHIGPVKSYEKGDDHTVRLILEAPRSWLPTGLSDPFSSMLPADFDPQKPIGTGPFKMGEIVQKESVTIIRFDKYHGTPAILDEVVLRPFEDPSALLNALQSGQIDIVNDVDASLVGEIEGNEDFKLYDSPTGRFFPIQMRTDVAPFSDARLRQALRLVLDREAVLNSVANGYAAVASDLYGRYDPNYNAQLIRDRDVEKAKALIEEAGLSGTELELVMYKDVATALVLSENAKEIGLNITVKQLDAAAFYNEEYFQRPFFGGDYYPSLPYFLVSALADAPNAGLDQVKWRDKEYLDLWLEAARTVDPDKLKQVMLKLQEILFERGAWIIPIFGNELAIYKKEIVGLPQFDQSGAGILRALSTIGFAG
ncbi:ABC transporter substrate-binding protein [Rhizobium sp. KVB221]|uniref:ABC transporter substrate-binding protein n=1 Tax=Rhizobium setariae TaxID=2801340 RepID=A0A937CRA8_9HYPH|nr:ABC transporter substrate-binding protein [Rhizobium setariae]MBL0374227.1 ABC transporter substrate-binding protein [Rhizobium setariae]